MQKILSRVAVVAILATMAVASFAQGIQWRGSYKVALDEAKKTNKLMMLSFFTTWDPYGKRLDAETYGNPEVMAVTQKFVTARLNVEGDGAAQAKKFKVKYYPTILFVDKNEQVVGTIDGFETPDEFVKHANLFIAEYAEHPKVIAALKKNPKDLKAMTRLGVIHAHRYEIGPAEAIVKKAEGIDPQNRTNHLSDLWNAVGDHYQNASLFEMAIRYFDKAARLAKDTDQRAYGYLSIATCYMTMPNPKFQKALTAAQAALKLPNLKAEDKEIGENIVQIARRGMAGG